MIYKLIAAALFIANVAGAPTPVDEVAAPAVEKVEENRRELFPLFAPGVKSAIKNAVRANGKGPAMAMGQGVKGPTKALEQLAAKDDMNTVVSSPDMCTRRHAMARAAGLAAGLSMAAVNAPAFAAETKAVKMGSDAGQLVFIPDEVKICKGDTVTWTNNKGGPHNVVFDEDNIPAGVNQEAISMDDQLADEGATFSKKFDTAGTYGYYCEPHRGAGMVATLIVS